MTWMKSVIVGLCGNLIVMGMVSCSQDTLARAGSGNVGAELNISAEKTKAVRGAEKARHVPDELLVTFEPGTPESRRTAIHNSMGVQVLNTMLSGRIAHIKIPKEKSLEEIQSAYAAFAQVEAVELNYITETR